MSVKMEFAWREYSKKAFVPSRSTSSDLTAVYQEMPLAVGRYAATAK
jgi:hypothetical protein